MYKTIVLFRTHINEDFEAVVEIDSKMTAYWPHPPGFTNDVVAAGQALGLGHKDLNALIKTKFQEMPMSQEQENMVHWLRGIELRARCNSDISGPFVINSQTEPSDDELKDWFVAQRKAKAAQHSKREERA